MRAAQLYRFSLRLYPAAFRRRHSAEMRQIFEDEWTTAARNGLPGRFAFIAHILADLARSAPRERLAALTVDDLVALATATGCGLAAAWVDLRAHEVESTLLVVAAGAVYFSFFAGARHWLWSVLLAGWLPLVRAGAFLLGVAPGGAPDRLFGSAAAWSPVAMCLATLVVALLGAFAGMRLRRALPRFHCS